MKHSAGVGVGVLYVSSITLCYNWQTVMFNDC